jgi:hypothetical protein
MEQELIRTNPPWMEQEKIQTNPPLTELEKIRITHRVPAKERWQIQIS